MSLDCLQAQLSRAGRIECPVCSAIAVLPIAVDAASLPNNFFLCDLMEQLPKSLLRQSTHTSSSANLALGGASVAASAGEAGSHLLRPF